MKQKINLLNEMKSIRRHENQLKYDYAEMTGGMVNPSMEQAVTFITVNNTDPVTSNRLITICLNLIELNSRKDTIIDEWLSILTRSGKTMQRTFDKLEQLLERKDEIENELHQLTGYYFAKPLDLYRLAYDDNISSNDFEKAFNLMIEYHSITNEITDINNKISVIEKELKK